MAGGQGWGGQIDPPSQEKLPSNSPALLGLSKIKIRIGNVNMVIIDKLDINSIRNKFEQLNETVLKYIDVLVVTETKLD